jgi:hypothetical protein
MILELLLLIIIVSLSYLLYYKRRTIDAFNNPERWAIIQYDNRELSHIDKDLCERNKRYAARHNYDYIFLKDGYDDYPPYWAKVAIMLEYLPKYDGVFWIDTDAAITDKERRIEDLGDRSKSFIMCPDPPMWSSPFNAGVWGVRNNDTGHSIMKDWMAIYHRIANEWKQEGTRWITSGAWAGDSYEQGSFAAHIWPKHGSAIDQLPWSVFQGTRPETPGAFALHFSSHQKDLRQGFINEHPLDPPPS